MVIASDGLPPNINHRSVISKSFPPLPRYEPPPPPPRRRARFMEEPYMKHIFGCRIQFKKLWIHTITDECAVM
ncbi:unnamed protein product [Adineta steineri]|uniref:Uncharacterized protein n=1 Tax=Adineta steineri TaxID=433720 RepID=A0A815GII9_9BILA|nr:unnamed protein product [Adineta steineri]CAF3707724.1 unnamed protein product [Adineta steineri]